MKFELLILASLLSQLSNTANIPTIRNDNSTATNLTPRMLVDNTVPMNNMTTAIPMNSTTPMMGNMTTQVPTNHTTPMQGNMTTQIVTLFPSFLGLSCYISEYQFSSLEPKQVIDKISSEIEKDPKKAIQIKFGNKTSDVYDLRCGLLIAKNLTSNKYNFKYDFFNKNDCMNDTGIICNKGNCSKVAQQCCESNIPFACNLYGLSPVKNTSCLQSNDTDCYEIEFLGGMPTTPSNNAVSKFSFVSNGIIPTMIIFVFSRLVKNIN